MTLMTLSAIAHAQIVVDRLVKQGFGSEYGNDAWVTEIAQALDEAEAKGIAKERKRIADMGYVIWDTGAYPVKLSPPSP